MPTLKYYKCHRPSCQRKEKGNFWSEIPTCPQCQLSAKDEKFGHLLQRLVIVHFDPPTDFLGLGHHVRACKTETAIQAPDGGGGIPNPWHAGTGVATHVNCQACRQTEAWQRAMEIIDHDEPADTAKLAPVVAASLERLEMASLAKKG